MTVARSGTAQPSPQLDASALAPLLIVLRDDGIGDHFAALLQRTGYPVVQAASPEEACDYLARQEVSLALVDIDWGNSSVFRIAEAARGLVRPCPVGVVVGWWDERVADVYRTADLLVYKPPTERQLLAAVESAVGRQALSA